MLLKGTTNMSSRMYPAMLQEVHDGDTMLFLIDRGLHDYASEWIRLLDVWCPELSQPGGNKATDDAEAWFHEHEDERGWYGIQTVKAGGRAEEKKTFVRYLATVYDLRSPMTTLNSHLNSLGYPMERPLDAESSTGGV